MLNLYGGPKHEIVASDSDTVFGIFTLLGYLLSPRIADLADQCLWRATFPDQTPSGHAQRTTSPATRSTCRKSPLTGMT